MASPLPPGALKAGRQNFLNSCLFRTADEVCIRMGSSQSDENIRKHEVSFLRAATVFRDPLGLSVFDQEHSDLEERWISIGQSSGGEILVVVHTFREISGRDVSIRIISARRATKREELQYREDK